MEKFAVLKGVNGWGDRLQCLLKAIGYARATGRALVVDWRDSDWSHDPNEPIGKWFAFKGVNSIPLSDFLDVFRNDRHGITVFPDVWKASMEQHDYQRLVYKKEYYNAVDHDYIHKITNGHADRDERVVVCSGVGGRSSAYSDFGSLVASDWLEGKVKASAAEIGLGTGGYDVVHLRGGSKSWAGGVVNLKSLEEKIRRAWPTRESYLQDMRSRLLKATEGKSDAETIVITDCSSLGRDFIDLLGRGRMIPTFNDHIRHSGIHKIEKKDLSALGSSKEAINIETIRDFCVMLNARAVVGDGISTFSKMGERCRAAGFRLVEFLPRSP